MKTISKIAAIALVAVALVGVNTASAQTVAELQAMIASLSAQIAALSGTTTTTPASVTFTSNLTVGSKGAEVTALQNFLIGKGYNTLATGYFGPMTKAALAAYQTAKGITPAAGYFGPLTRASVNGEAGTPGTPSTPTTPGVLQGGAGSIESTSLISAYNNEEVGESTNDVKVYGLEVEADDGSDLEITAVRVVFAKLTATNDDFGDFAEKVSIMVDGKEYASVDADTFNDDNTYTKTVSLSNGAIIKAGKTGQVVIAIDGVSNLDSVDEGKTWTVDVASLRFADADGAVVTEAVDEVARTFSFEGFAASSDTAFKIQSGDNAVNDSRVIDIDDADETKNVSLLSFKVKVDGNADVELKDLPILATFGGTGVATTLDDMFSQLTLTVDSTEIGSENPTASTSVVFNDLDYVLKPGTYNFTLKGDILATSSATVAVGDTVSFTLGETQTDSGYFDAEDEEGDNLLDADVTGEETSGPLSLFVDGISVALDTTLTETAKAYSVDAVDNDRVELTLKFKVTNFGEETLYIPSLATFKVASTSEVRTAPTTANGIGYALQFTGTTSILAANVSHTLVSSADSETNSFAISSGDTETFTLTVKVANTAATGIDNTTVRALLSGVNWATSNSATGASVYVTDLLDIETGYATIAD